MKTRSLKAYRGRFLKTNREERTMNFIKIEDLPKDFLDSIIKGRKSPIGRIKDNFELVWDIDKDSFRYFNNKTKIGRLVPYDYILRW